MQDYTLSHVYDVELLRGLAALVTRERITTAMLLAHIAEVDARRLYVPVAYFSMHAYCVGELRLSEDAAKRRIQAARAARQFPAIFHAVAEGALHLTGVCLIAPHLTNENARTLIESASHKRKIEIEELLARHFPLPEAHVRTLTPVSAEIRQSLVARSEEQPGSDGTTLNEGALAHLPHLQGALPPATAERYLLQVIIAKSTQDKLRYLRDLLSHAVPDGDVAEVLDRAFDALITKIETRRFGSARPRQQAKEAPNNATEEERIREVVAGLRGLGCSAHETRRAATSSHGNTLEERIPAALKLLGQRRP
jgi:hypothetical protein